jgi:hypothetical protein
LPAIKNTHEAKAKKSEQEEVKKYRKTSQQAAADRRRAKVYFKLDIEGERKAKLDGKKKWGRRDGDNWKQHVHHMICRMIFFPSLRSTPPT